MFKVGRTEISCADPQCFCRCKSEGFPSRGGGGGVLYIFWVRGRAIGKGIDFHDFGIRNGINFRNFHNWSSVGYAFSENWYKVGYAFSENWYKVGYMFLKNWYKVGYT